MLHTVSHRDISSVLRSCHFQSTTNFSNDHNIWYLFLRILFETAATLTLYTSKQGGVEFMVDSHLRAFLRTDVTGDASVFDVFHYFPSEDGPMEAGDLTKNACVENGWIQSCLQMGVKCWFLCHLVSLCFVAHHFIKLTLISNIGSLGINASADSDW